jgi:KaiC/GvpD/RAD55 family RecA-like ATPase
MSFDEVVDALTANAVTLITGPPMTGKYDFLVRVVAETSDGVIFVTTKHGAGRVIDDFRSRNEAFPNSRFGVIDCVGDQWRDDDPSIDPYVRYVNGPGDLTSIGVQFTELSTAFRGPEEGERVAIGLHSISQLVMNADFERVYKFLQVLTGQIRTAGWYGLCVAEQRGTDDLETTMLKHHFDNVIEIREAEDGRREYRIRGRTQTAGWEPY